MMKANKIYTLLVFILTSIAIHAQGVPSVNPTATYDETAEKTDEGSSFSAPVTGHFAANPSNVGDYNATYEWRFYTEGQEDTPYLVRYEEETEYTFTTAGAHRIMLYATFINGTDTVKYDKVYWTENPEVLPFKISIYESKLEMPNAFSPNNDDFNNTYRAKEGYKSIVEFHAYIFNRWGQKLYEWHDPSGEWDGTYKGKPVKDGVYFCLVKARGADGRKFNIKTDVNLLRGYNQKENNNATTP